MQLTIEVLPAPFGPMMENSSPSLTAKLTSVSARTPPKRNETPRTSNVWSNHPSRIRRLSRSLSGVHDLGAILYRQCQVSHAAKGVLPPWIPDAIRESHLAQRPWLGATASIR